MEANSSESLSEIQRKASVLAKDLDESLLTQLNNMKRNAQVILQCGILLRQNRAQATQYLVEVIQSNRSVWSGGSMTTMNISESIMREVAIQLLAELPQRFSSSPA